MCLLKLAKKESIWEEPFPKTITMPHRTDNGLLLIWKPRIVKKILSITQKSTSSDLFCLCNSDDCNTIDKINVLRRSIFLWPSDERRGLKDVSPIYWAHEMMVNRESTAIQFYNSDKNLCSWPKYVQHDTTSPSGISDGLSF